MTNEPQPLVYERVESPQGSSLNTVTSNDFDWKTPAVLCMGGVDVIDKRAASGFAKLAGRLLEGSKEEQGVRLFTAMYPDAVKPYSEEISDLSTLTTEGPGHPRPDYAKPIAKQLVKDFFKPHIDKVFETSENPLEQLAQDFNKLTLFTYSYGTYIAPYIHQGLEQVLSEHRVSEKETDELLRHIHLLGFGESGIWHTQQKDGWNFTSLHMASTSDYYVQLASKLTKPTEQFVTLQDKPNVGLVLNSLTPQGFVVEQSTNDHHLDGGKKASHHPYNYALKREDGISSPDSWLAPRMLENALHNMVYRSGEPKKAIELLEPAKSKADYSARASHYRERLQAAGMAPGSNNIAELKEWPSDWQGVIENQKTPATRAI